MRVATVMTAVLGVAFLASAPARAQDGDSKEARIRAAERYLKEVSMKEMMDDMADKMSKTLPPAQATALKDLMKKVDVTALESAAKDGLVKHMTVKEITALTNFYGSPEGKAIMKKFGVYMAELQPIIQREIQKAANK